MRFTGGYKNAIADTSAGNSGRLSGDIVSLQMIKKSSMKGKYFSVFKDMKNTDVKKVMSDSESTPVHNDEHCFGQGP